MTAHVIACSARTGLSCCPSRPIQRVTLDEEGALRAVVLLDEPEPGGLFAGGVRFDELEDGESQDSGEGFLVRLLGGP